MRDFNSKSAPGGNPFTGPFCRTAQPDISLGAENLRYTLQEVHSDPVSYLEKAEIDALLAAPNVQSAQGQRDHRLLLFLYNTGARADEAAQVLVGDLNLAHAPNRDLSSVRIRGKGNKVRHCPLWPQTVHEFSRQSRDGGRPSTCFSTGTTAHHPFRYLRSRKAIC